MKMKARMKFFVCGAAALSACFFCAAQDFRIGADDVRVETEFRPDGRTVAGYHLYVRKTPTVKSVLLTETTKDPSGQEASYAYRAPEWNAVNGDEVRILDGRRLDSPYARFSIIDSTPESDGAFGQAFHLYVPTEMVYGYPWTRNGTVRVDAGTFVNIRAFGAEHGDYSGGFGDNPFMFAWGESPGQDASSAPEEVVVVTDAYNPAAATEFASLARSGDGEITYSRGPGSIVEDVLGSLARLDPSRPADVVFAVDATGSMKDDIQQLRSTLVEALGDVMAGFGGRMRFGLLLYRDYTDNFRYNGLPVRFFPFTGSLGEFERSLNSFSIYGTEGGDVPEAVYEALFAAMDFYDWDASAQKKVVLIGDAEAHPKPRGTKIYTRELVEATALARGIKIDTIITPDEKPRDEK